MKLYPFAPKMYNKSTQMPSITKTPFRFFFRSGNPSLDSADKLVLNLEYIDASVNLISDLVAGTVDVKCFVKEYEIEKDV